MVRGLTNICSFCPLRVAEHLNSYPLQEVYRDGAFWYVLCLCVDSYVFLDGLCDMDCSYDALIVATRWTQ